MDPSFFGIALWIIGSLISTVLAHLYARRCKILDPRAAFMSCTVYTGLLLSLGFSVVISLILFPVWSVLIGVMLIVYAIAKIEVHVLYRPVSREISLFHLALHWVVFACAGGLPAFSLLL